MKLSRNQRLKTAAAAFSIGFILGAVQNHNTFIFLTTKVVAISLFIYGAYLCKQDIKKYGIPKEE